LVPDRALFSKSDWRFGGGEAENARQDVPFSAPAPALGLGNGEWLVGAWEWIAPLPDGAILLLASGTSAEVALRRATLMALSAKNAGLEVRECWALTAAGEQTEAELVTA
jgi:hypothetical protein